MLFRFIRPPPSLLLSLEDDGEFVAHLFYIRKTKEFGNNIQLPLEMAQDSLPFYNSQFNGKHFPKYCHVQPVSCSLIMFPSFYCVCLVAARWCWLLGWLVKPGSSFFLFISSPAVARSGRKLVCSVLFCACSFPVCVCFALSKCVLLVLD